MGRTGTIYAGKKMETFPPEGILAYNCKLIDKVVYVVINMLVEVMLFTVISPGIVL